MNFQVINDIEIKKPEISKDRIIANYKIDQLDYKIFFKYQGTNIERKHAEIISLMPVVNYSLFTKRIDIDFPISKEDLYFFKKSLKLNSVEIYVNKLIKRPEFFKHEYIPSVPNESEASWVPEIEADISSNWEKFHVNDNSVGIMSSGGKESLLTYGLMKEIGADVYPIYFNESGGHWRTAVTAYRYMKETDPNTLKIWSDVDRFYKSLNSHLPIFKENALKMWSDTYPIQLFIFPVYIFASLPYIKKFEIGNIMKGDEFDDPSVFQPTYGIKHFYGILDQTKYFDDLLTYYFDSIGLNIKFFSAVRHITGLIEERILNERYPELLRLQRSCHSCHFEGDEIIPCGRCSKCNGILLFLGANHIDPRLLNYKEDQINAFNSDYLSRVYRIDESEKDHAIFKFSDGKFGKFNPSVEKIHFCKDFSPEDTIPDKFRSKIIKIFEKYTLGYERC